MDLSRRDKADASSERGRGLTARFTQTRQFLRPLFRKLKLRTLDADIVRHIEKICQQVQLKDYLKAHEAYLTLSIGNAAWPMGVTMVGIHERAGRERISNDQIAHILNDEETRKWIQAMKRLLSYVQWKFPSDPSKMFENLADIREFV